MTPRHIAIIFRRRLQTQRVLQIGLLCAFWLAGDRLAQWAHLPLPGSILGMLALLLLLLQGGIGVRSVKQGASWFLAEMLLFFVPAVVAIVNHHEFLGWLGVKTLLVIVTGTALVMAVTALAIEYCLRWQMSEKEPDYVVE